MDSGRKAFCRDRKRGSQVLRQIFSIYGYGPLSSDSAACHHRNQWTGKETFSFHYHITAKADAKNRITSYNVCYTKLLRGKTDADVTTIEGLEDTMRAMATLTDSNGSAIIPRNNFV